MGKFKDLTGKKFGRLYVQSIKGKTRDNKRYIYHCVCDCGNECDVLGELLSSGKTKSCGCLRKETASRISRKYNIYDLSGSYGIGYTTNTNEKFYFDLGDYDKIKNYAWHKNKSGYLVYLQNDGHKYSNNIILSRIIMNAPTDMVVDHINHNKLDNRKSNLRLATVSQNGMNHIISKDNKSGNSGVWYDKINKKWCASITCGTNNIWLGRFVKYEDAVIARKNAEVNYFKNFQYNSSLKFSL